MNLGTDNYYTVVSLAMYWLLTRGLLACCVSGISCLLSAGYLQARRERAHLIQAGDNACLLETERGYNYEPAL